jgi:mono/diheme cytochrome c family protein
MAPIIPLESHNMTKLYSRPGKITLLIILSNGFLIPLFVVLFSGCTQQKEPVSYQRNIAPLLAEHCGRCHQSNGRGTQNSGFAMDSYEQLIKGTRIGQVVKPGDATGSTLLSLVEGRADPAIRMPPDGHNPLNPDEIQLIRDWINEGANNN